MPEPDDTGQFLDHVLQHLERLYPTADLDALAQELIDLLQPFADAKKNRATTCAVQSRYTQVADAAGSPTVTPANPTAATIAAGPEAIEYRPAESPWSAADCLLISYGDSIVASNERPLRTLRQFLDSHCRGAITALHILPFYPFSSDDGFAVIDYLQVRDDLGSWEDIDSLAGEYRLMADVVINHVSTQCDWFTKYCNGDEAYQDFFIEAKLNDDLSQVVRPRTTPLLRATETADGFRQLWCTFGHDQIDVNFANSEVLKSYIKIIGFYLSQGAEILRLDAVGYLWKTPGTSCIHLPQTHEVVKLIRTLCDQFFPGTILITETNVPIHENLTYFGNRNEAHVIYNFSLAPLLVHSLLTGETQYLKRWMMSMPPAPDGCAYLNFTASHDGIGMRPAEGLLSDQEQVQMVETIRRHGGLFSARQTPDGTERIYELNVALFDALRGTTDGEDDFQVERFICSQTVMLGIEGIPAMYIHSLLATGNDLALVQETGRARSINRHRWEYEQLQELLNEPSSNQRIVLDALLRRVRIRAQQSAFHPNATQFTLQSDPAIFAFWRQSRDRQQSIFAIHNMTNQPQQLSLAQMNLIAGDSWRDLLSDTQIDDLTATIDVEPYQCLWISNR